MISVTIKIPNADPPRIVSIEADSILCAFRNDPVPGQGTKGHINGVGDEDDLLGLTASVIAWCRRRFGEEGLLMAIAMSTVVEQREGGIMEELKTTDEGPAPDDGPLPAPRRG